MLDSEKLGKIVKVEAMFYSDTRKLGEDFNKLEAFLLFSNGTEFPVQYRYKLDIIDFRITFWIDVTGIDQSKLRGVFFKDKNGEIRCNE